MHRRRHQKGSLQVRQHRKRKMWVLLYRDGNTRKYATLGRYAKMSKSQAEEKRAEILGEANARNALSPDPDITFGEFLDGVCFPFLRSKWKRSTAATTENRIKHHLDGEFGVKKLYELRVKELQAFLAAKAETLSRSVVAHLRWDLRAIFASWRLRKAMRRAIPGSALHAQASNAIRIAGDEHRGGGTIHQSI